MEQSENKLLQQIQEFRKKYYLNQIIRGSLILVLLFSLFLFIAITGEGLMNLSSSVRTGMFWCLVLGSLGVLGSMVIWPATKFFNISNGISDMDIAKIVRKYFPEIDDKLINLLELKGASETDTSLAMAAIEKKTSEIAPIPIARAINLNLNLKYARYLAIPAILFLCVYFLSPNLLLDGSTRLMNYKKEYPKPQPFYIEIGNHPDELISGENYKLETKVKGDELPAELYLYLKKESESEFINYPMEKGKGIDKNEFSFEFTDIKEKFSYFIGNQEVESDKLDVNVLKRPSIRKFRVVMDYPDYTGIPSDTLSDNIGDIKALKGTVAKWVLEPNGNVNKAVYVGGDTASFVKEGDVFQRKKAIMDDEQYFLSLTSDQDIENADTVKYYIDVLSDRFPSIYVNAPGGDFQADFTMLMPMDFEISDDFGFSKLALYYRFINSDDAAKSSPQYSLYSLNVNARELLQQKSLEIDLFSLGMEEGDEVEYFIKVWDNDYVTGPKESQSSVYTINYPSLTEQYDEVGENQEEMNKDMDELLDDVKELKEGFEKMQEKLLQQKNLNYDDKKELKNLLDKQQNVKEQMQSLQKNFEQNKQKLQNNQMISEQTLEKYEKLNDYIQKMDNPLLDKLMEELQKNMEELDPEDIKKAMEEMELNEKELEESIERTMELMKQLEVEQKTDELMQKLDNLKEKQDQLNDQTEKAKTEEDFKKVEEKQEKLNKEMEKIEEDLKELEEMKSDTETPDKEEMEDIKKDAEDSKQSMEDAKQQAGQKKKNKSSGSQKNASQKMQDMQDKLSQMQASSQMEQDEQNLENLREIIENLIRLSFKQEDLREDVKKLKYGDPQLSVKGRVQKELQDDMEMVRDSLNDLAKKVFQLEKFITDETKTVIKSMKDSQIHIRNKQTKRITNEQTKSMTSINNLANMLSDVMSQMQEQMKNMKPGNGQCKKPGSGKPNMGKMGQQQKDLNGKMKDMFEKMNGKPGQKKPGGKKPGASGMAEMAAQQEALRKQLKEASENSEDGELLGDMEQIMKDMKKTEEDLMNQNLTAETLFRQEKILQRMLDANKAVREKEEFENRRESITGREIDRNSPDELSIDQFKNMIRQELLKSNQLEYTNDFINLIEKYYKMLEKGENAE